MEKTVTEKNEILLAEEVIQNRIFNIRGKQVMLDRDLAELYGVETKRLNEQVKRNANRFPARYCFQLTEIEKDEVVANCDHLESLKFSPSLPFAFSEQGVSMISAVLKSPTAIKVSIQIIDSFIAMRKFIYENAMVFQRLDRLDNHQLHNNEKFEKIFKALENKSTEIEKGIFFDGQVFDSYVFIADIIRKANHSIILIDNYVDESVLNLFTKRKEGVEFTIYTKSITKQLSLDLEKHNSQYSPVTIKAMNLSHDRFLILDDDIVYHIGASLKDLGKKWFAFSKMDNEALNLLNRLEERK